MARYQEEAERAGSALRRAEKDAAEKEMEVEELQRLLASMEKVPRDRDEQIWDWESAPGTGRAPRG